MACFHAEKMEENKREWKLFKSGPVWFDFFLLDANCLSAENTEKMKENKNSKD